MDTCSKDSYSDADESDIDERLFKYGARLNARRKTLHDLIHPLCEISINDELTKLEKLSCFIGASSYRTNNYLRVAGLATWMVSLLVQFAYDVYTSIIIKVYGGTFLFAQLVLFTCLVTATIGMARNTLPWLANGLQELRFEKCYEKSIEKTLRIIKFFPYVVIPMAVVSSALQMVITHVDVTSHDPHHHHDHGDNVTFGMPADVTVYAVRYLAGCHVYGGYTLFWLIPSAIMLLTGFSMSEFMDQMSIKMKDRNQPLTFKDAIHAYSRRAGFVKTSSNQSHIVLSFLIVTSVLCFGLNAYIFLFGKRHYLHLWHAILPTFLMLCPLCAAAWVTKQYLTFIIVVVRAWVIDDLEDDDESDEADEVVYRKDSTDSKSKSRNSLHRHSDNFTNTIKSKLSALTASACKRNSEIEKLEVVLEGRSTSPRNAPINLSQTSTVAGSVISMEEGSEKRSAGDIELLPWMAKELSSGKPMLQEAIKMMEVKPMSKEHFKKMARAPSTDSKKLEPISDFVTPVTKTNTKTMAEEVLHTDSPTMPSMIRATSQECKSSTQTSIEDITGLAKEHSLGLPTTQTGTTLTQRAPLKKQLSCMATIAKAATKFRKAVKKQTFNFEKFLSYLENMRPVVGFQILGTMVTWDLVTTIIFLLFSIVAVFVQESIFGSSN